MRGTSTLLDLLDWLSRAGVLNLRETHALRRRCEELGSGIEQEQIIAGLVAQKKLTNYQAAEIRAGRHEELVQGNYLLLDLIRASQMGVVYRARQIALRRMVALKLLPEHVAQAAGADSRFRREVEATARLNHPRIVAASDAGRIGRTLYLATEFIEGENLGDYVRRRGKLALRDALRSIEQAAEGLSAAHAAGIVHRDVKPSNLMLTTEGEVKLLDLGLARFLSDEQATDNLTATEDLTGGGMLGTIDFMAPEQTRDSRSVDHRADIYGLGCTLYYLLAGVPPAPPGDWRTKLEWHASAPIPRLRNVCPLAPAELQGIFDRMLARDAGHRFSSCAELRSELLAILAQSSDESGSLQPGAAVAGMEPLPPPLSDSSQTDVSSQAQVDTKGDLVFQIVDSAASAKPQPAQKAKINSGLLVGGLTGGVAAGIVILGLVIMLLMNTQTKRRAVAGPARPPAKEKSGSVSPRIAGSQAPQVAAAAPQGTTWNRDLKAEVQRIFPRGVEGGPGRNLYSEADAAMEQFLDGDWYVGSGLTADGQAVQVQVRQGKFFTAPMSEEQVREDDLQPSSIHRSSDSRLKLRYRPLMQITEAEFSLIPLGGNSQRVLGRVKTEVLKEAPIDSVSLVLESVINTKEAEGTRQLYASLDWTKTEAGWHVFDRIDEGNSISGRFSYRLYVMAWSWSPKPGFFRLTQEYQGRFEESVSGSK